MKYKIYKQQLSIIVLPFSFSEKSLVNSVKAFIKALYRAPILVNGRVVKFVIHARAFPEVSILHFFPLNWGKKWRISEHAHASYPGLSLRASGFNLYVGRAEGRVQGLDY